MHYGWPADVDFFFNYALQHRLIRYLQKFVPDDENGEKMIDVIDRHASASDALEHIVESIGGSSSPRHIELESVVVQSHNPIIVSLFTNYTIPHAPTQEFKKLLCERLGFTGEPKWYLDGLDWH